MGGRWSPSPPIPGTARSSPPSGAPTAWLTDLGARAVLVRPDFYLYGAATDADDLDSVWLDHLRSGLQTDGAPLMSGPDVPEPRLLWARHHVVNTLVRYLRALDDHDLDGVLAELSHATVDFGGSLLKGMEALAETYRAALAAGGRTRHLLHEVEVVEHGAGVVGRARVPALGTGDRPAADQRARWLPRRVRCRRRTVGAWSSSPVHRDWQRT